MRPTEAVRIGKRLHNAAQSRRRAVTERGKAPVEPTAKEYAAQLRRTAEDLNQYAEAIEMTNDVNCDWNEQWSSHSHDAAGAVFDSMTN